MSILIRHKLKIGLGFVLIFLAAAGVFAAGKPVASQSEAPSAWAVRCNQQTDGYCETYWRYTVPETGQRVAEFAVGYPKDAKAARGVMVLPLGILLTDDVQMQIDNGQAFKFKVRYCTDNGCLAYLNINKELLGMLRNGTLAVVSLKNMQGQNVRIEIPLAGFAKKYDQVS